MRKLFFATSNKGKFAYLSDRFRDFGVTLIMAPMELPEPRSDNLQEIAKEKALSAFTSLKKPCIVTDAGFYVRSLNGFPKAFANFALKTIGVEGILKLTEGKPRNCEFVNCIAFMDSKLKEPAFFEMGIRGMLSETPRGKLSEVDWSELSLIFIPEGETKTLGEMTTEKRKQLVNQRWGHTYRDVAEWLLKRK